MGQGWHSGPRGPAICRTIAQGTCSRATDFYCYRLKDNKDHGESLELFDELSPPRQNSSSLSLLMARAWSWVANRIEKDRGWAGLALG